MSESSPVAEVAALARARVLVIGDVMLDRSALGEVERISPEAPVPVFRATRRESVLGGAGNVLMNLIELGAEARLLTVVGADPDAEVIRSTLAAAGTVTDGVITQADRPTTSKERFFAQGQQLLRVDQETTAPISNQSQDRLLEQFAAHRERHPVMILSDYRKGVLTPDLVTAVLRDATQGGARVLIDPKGEDYSHYHGAWLLTPNVRELRLATGRPVETDDEVVAACRWLIAEHELGGVLATRGELGMSLVLDQAQPIHLKAQSREVFDITGAGDTVIATLAAGLAAGLAPERAALIANVAAGIVVGKRGTARASPAEIMRALKSQASPEPFDKFVGEAKLLTRIELCRAMRLRVGFTNGCFDLLHPGHLSLLNQARAECDFLIVGLNSDASISRLKGPGRPAQDETSRAGVLASLSAVDQVVIFDEATPEALIEKIRPDVLVKGADYRREDVVGGDLVESYGGRVILATIKEGFSTSSIIEKLPARA